MTSFASPCHLLSFLICLSTIHAAAAAAASSTSAQLVDEVCENASSYTFCVEALSSDPRTEHASGWEQMADISVRLAYNNATSTQSYIGELLGNSSSQGDQQARLRRCRHDYAKAVKAIEVAGNDVNSEDFDELPDLANDAALAANDCDAALQRTPSSPVLGNSNQNLMGLCEIFAIVARFLTSG